MMIKWEKIGKIFNIQRYSIQDGPGIRTTVFLKGCPLRCKWCANPESQNLYPELIVREDLCIHNVNGCKKCLDICPKEAVSFNEDGDIQIDRAKCDLCMRCVDVCNANAISCVGMEMSVEEVMEEISMDDIFYNSSDGGMTMSGGEPLFQPEFTLEVLKACKKKSIHTAIDTSGYAEWGVIDSFLKYADLILFDIKHLDPVLHREYIGKGNALILGNLEKIMAKNKRLWIRIPVIPNYNDSEHYAKKLAEFLSGKNFEKVSLLGYHEFGKQKYENLGRKYSLMNYSPVGDEKLQRLKDIIVDHEINVTIGR